MIIILEHLYNIVGSEDERRNGRDGRRIEQSMQNSILTRR